MSQKTKPGEKANARDIYADIISLPRWEPGKKHRRMSLHDRAAQFAPFAALTGYDEMLDEEARLTDRQIEPGEEQLNELNRKLNRINDLIARGVRPEGTVTYFVPDEKKAGGRYAAVTAGIRRVDIAGRKLFLMTRGRPDLPETILFDRILDIQGDQIGEPEDHG